MAIIEYKRIVQKNGDGVPTIPPSPSHDTGDWIATDIYENEVYMDNLTRKVYTRIGDSIVPVGDGGQSDIAIDFVDGVGANPPTEVDGDVYVIQNETGAPIMDVNTIQWQAVSGRVRYAFNSFAMMTSGVVAIGDYFHVIGATNPKHNGSFVIVAFNDVAGWIEIVNPLVTDATDDEASNSPATAYFTKAAWDGAKINDIVKFESSTGLWYITTPTDGQTIINLADHQAYIFNGTAWIALVDSSISIGDTVIGGAPKALLYIDAAGNLKDSIILDEGDGATFAILSLDGGATGYSTIAGQAQIFSVNGYFKTGGVPSLLDNHVTVASTEVYLRHGTQITIDSPKINLPQLTADTLPRINNLENLVSSSIAADGNNLFFNANYGIDTTVSGGSDVLNIGATNAEVINYGNAFTTHNFLGTAIYELQVNSYVADKLITLNSGGAVASGIGVGFEIEEGGAIKGYLKTNAARSGLSIKAPANTDYTDLIFSATVPRTKTFQDTSSTIAEYGDKLSVFAATTSAELAGVISDETGTGLLVFGTSPTIKTSLLLRNPADTFSYSFLPSAITADRNITVPLILSNQTMGLLPTFVKTTGNNPTGTADLVTRRMMGLGSVASITCGSSGAILINWFRGVALSSAANSGVNIRIVYGTGVAPANAAAETGTVEGSNTGFINSAATEREIFSMGGYVTGLTPGTTYWFDVSLLALTGGTGSIAAVDILLSTQ